MTVCFFPPTLSLHTVYTLPPCNGPVMVSQSSCPAKAALSCICNSLKLSSAQTEAPVVVNVELTSESHHHRALRDSKSGNEIYPSGLVLKFSLWSPKFTRLNLWLSFHNPGNPEILGAVWKILLKPRHQSLCLTTVQLPPTHTVQYNRAQGSTQTFLPPLV